MQVFMNSTPVPLPDMIFSQLPRSSVRRPAVAYVVAASPAEAAAALKARGLLPDVHVPADRSVKPAAGPRYEAIAASGLFDVDQATVFVSPGMGSQPPRGERRPVFEVGGGGDDDYVMHGYVYPSDVDFALTFVRTNPDGVPVPPPAPAVHLPVDRHRVEQTRAQYRDSLLKMLNDVAEDANALRRGRLPSSGALDSLAARVHAAAQQARILEFLREYAVGVEVLHLGEGIDD